MVMAIVLGLTVTIIIVVVIIVLIITGRKDVVEDVEEKGNDKAGDGETHRELLRFLGSINITPFSSNMGLWR